MRDRELGLLDTLAAFVHGSVAFGNALGILYNVHRRKWGWVAFHALGVVVHTKATLDHARALRG